MFKSIKCTFIEDPFWKGLICILETTDELLNNLLFLWCQWRLLMFTETYTWYRHYCNSLIYSIYDYNTNRLQRIKRNAACRVINIWKQDHIIPTVQNLHWLPVRQRIHFKILLITYKSINNMASEYMYELVSNRKSTTKRRMPLSWLKS